MSTKTCPCGNRFTPKRSTAVYCSNACRQKSYRQQRPESRGIAHLGIEKDVARELGRSGIGSKWATETHAERYTYWPRVGCAKRIRVPTPRPETPFDAGCVGV